jgi:Uma2 family endonuclease
MTAAAVAPPPPVTGDKRVVLPRVSWETYERLLADDEERRIPRMTFDRGVLELVTPSMPHDEDAGTIARFVEVATAIMGIPIRSVGATTFRRRDLERGFEPDEIFYIQSEPRIRVKRQVDLSVDPPPDLVLEMEMSRSAINKLALFAAMGIPEVWRPEGERIIFHILVGGAYRESATSLALPMLTSDVLARFLEQSQTLPSPEWFQAVSEWARQASAS